MDNILFCDSSGYAELQLTENSENGRTRFRGRFQEADAENKNKRKYPYAILESNRKRLMEAIKGRACLGELDHPNDSIIHFEKASHLITNLWWEGKTLYGEAEILLTPSGKILENLIKSGVRVGISSRGVGNGTTNADGILVIGESYKLITFDAVADPSTFNAYQEIVANNDKKHESIVKKEIIPETSDEKLQNESINNFNQRATVAYLGQVIRNYTSKFIREV